MSSDELRDDLRVIDFLDQANRRTYRDRSVDPTWVQAFADLIPIAGRTVADIGTGGGLYAQAIRDLEPSVVFALDFALSTLSTAKAEIGRTDIQFVAARAAALPLADRSIDAVIERALIHHFDSLADSFREIGRVLAPGGILWLQDRTPEDVSLPGSPSHIRGYFLEYEPRLVELELARRHPAASVGAALEDAGFRSVTQLQLMETRDVFESPSRLMDDIVSRRGRSLLHALTDRELASLARRVVGQVDAWPVIERDRWTVWVAKTDRT